MTKQISVDCGKYNTKTCYFDQAKGDYTKSKFRTKVSKGTFDDDMLEKGTFLVRYQGETYKVGMGARQEADMETSKRDDIHKISTIAAIALSLAPNSKEEIDVCIGIPLQTCLVTEERLAYKSFILPDGLQEVELKLDNKSAPYKVSFKIRKKYVYPEGIGVIYEYPSELKNITGIIDIGNLNVNCLYCNMAQPTPESSFTDELGGQVLISGLAQELSSQLGMRVDDNLAASILLKSKDERYLIPKNGNEEIMELSKKVITEYTREHVKLIKRKLDTKRWPLDFMNLVFIGGTSNLLKNELIEVFGDSIIIPKNPEFVNVEGFMKRMCSNIDVDIFSILNKKNESKKTEKTA